MLKGKRTKCVLAEHGITSPGLDEQIALSERDEQFSKSGEQLA